MAVGAKASSSSAAASFASLLAGLTTPRHQADSYWNDSALAEDVATISYEQALRSHARYRPPDAPAESTSAMPHLSAGAAGAAGAASVNEDSLPPRKPPLPERNPDRSPERSPERSPDRIAPPRIAFVAPPPTLAESRKSSSVTIRLSDVECEQLHKRAADAGLTVSAYLRSCVFEVEALRAQVKDAVAQLRSTPSHEPKPVQQPAESMPLRTVLSSWLSRLLARLHKGHRLVPGWAARSRAA